MTEVEDQDMENSDKFFANKECRYYPCHKCSEDINCLFCYCPLYDTDCPGNYRMQEKDGRQIKTCIDCAFPHLAGNYDRLIELIREKNSRS